MNAVLQLPLADGRVTLMVSPDQAPYDVFALTCHEHGQQRAIVFMSRAVALAIAVTIQEGALATREDTEDPVPELRKLIGALAATDTPVDARARMHGALDALAAQLADAKRYEAGRGTEIESLEERIKLLTQSSITKGRQLAEAEARVERLQEYASAELEPLLFHLNQMGESERDHIEGLRERYGRNLQPGDLPDAAGEE